MKKLITTIVLLFSLQFLIAQENGLRKVFIADNKVAIELPVSFSDASYIENNTWMIRNKTGMVTLTYEAINNENIIAIADNDIPAWTDKQLSLQRKDSLFQYIDDGIFLHDGKNIGYIKSSRKQQKGFYTFHVLFYVSVDNKPLQFRFTCPLKNRSKWEPVVDAIANSIRLVR